MADTIEEVLTPTSLGGLRVSTAKECEGPERVLIYGQAGIGKTPLLASANRVAAFSPALIINADKKDATKSIKLTYPEVSVINVDSFQQLYDVFAALWQKKGAGFRSVHVDGATTVQVRGIEHLYYSQSGGRNRNFIDFETARRQNGGWSASTDQMRTLFDAFGDLSTHLFFTAWARDMGKPKTNRMDELVKPSYVPDFTPAVLNAACGRFSSILYYHVHTSGKRVLQSVTTSTVMARDRGDRLPSTIENPTMDILAKYWGLDASLVNGGIPEYKRS